MQSSHFTLNKWTISGALLLKGGSAASARCRFPLSVLSAYLTALPSKMPMALNYQSATALSLFASVITSQAN
eukprot:scaffold154151_cov26-Prasinocladus_malaysianus.AAC.1